MNFKWNYLLLVVVALTLLYSIVLSLKRYNNYEYGKFDLGNMSQMVWNSANGHFMEVTDQFGTNMPRWGMSHVDPILLVFVPIYWVYDHPMIMVFIQQFVVLSAAFALYSLVKLKTNSRFLGLLAGLAYTFYPAVGYTLIWTTYHGVSFVAPVLIWIIYFLEKNHFLKDEKFLSKKIIYWVGIVVMLLGKEQIGIMVALSSLFLFKYNRRLAIQTFVVSMVWFVFAFFILIPAYAPQRERSVDRFIHEIGITNAEPEEVQGENFFLVRYSYLGDSYFEIIKNSITNPRLVFKYFDDNVKVINDLIGPLGYIVILSPFWLITTPDLAISMLSSEKIFGIDNHRIAFIISGLFISYIYLLFYINTKFKVKTAIAFALICLLSTVFFSYKTENPLFVSATSFLNEKVIKKVLAQDSTQNKKEKIIGTSQKGSVPRNTNQCLDYVVNRVYVKNPSIYTGPDYLGAHTSNRYVNALFPSRITDADMIVADLFDEKALDRVGVEAWFTNKLALEKIILNDYNHTFSCGMVNVFEKSKGEQSWSSTISLGENLVDLPSYPIITPRIELLLTPKQIPLNADLNKDTYFEIALTKTKGNFGDSVSYWKFKNGDLEYSMIDYLTAGNTDPINQTNDEENNTQNYYEEKINIVFPPYLEPGQYDIYYGVGELVKATEVYLGEITINE